MVEMNENQDVQSRSDPHPNPPHKGEGTSKEFARSLRKNATLAERTLWQELRLLKSEDGIFAAKFQLINTLPILPAIAQN
jgi:Protein of unknown function (DUF559)